MRTMLVRTSFPSAVRISASVAVPFVPGVIMPGVIVACVWIGCGCCRASLSGAALRCDDGASFNRVRMIHRLQQKRVRVRSRSKRNGRFARCRDAGEASGAHRLTRRRFAASDGSGTHASSEFNTSSAYTT
jgi:hypothetical protein